MAIALSDNLAIGTAAPADVRYGPWAATTIDAAKDAALAGIGNGVRFQGLTVGLIATNVSADVVEYWWPGVADSTLTPPTFTKTLLLEKSSSSQGGAVEILQTGTSISTAIQKINVNSPAGSGLVAAAKPLSTITTNPTSITTDGTYPGLTTTVSPAGGTGAIVSAIVSSGTVSSVTVTTPGTGYAVNNTLTVSQAQLAGASGNLVVTLQASDLYDGSLMPIEVTLNTIYDTQLGDAQESVLVGGITEGTTAGSLKGDTLVDILNKILFPTQPPAYTIPVASFGDTAGGFIEVGSDIDNDLTLSLIKNDSGGYDTATPATIVRTNPDTTFTANLISGATPTVTNPGNLAPQYGIPNANNDNEKTLFTHTDAITNLQFGTTSYAATISCTAGSQLDDSSGNPSGNAIPLQTLTKALSFTTAYPYFWGVQNTIDWTTQNDYDQAATDAIDEIEVGFGNKVAANGTGNITIPYVASANTGDFMWFAIPSASNSLKLSWVDPLSSTNTAPIVGTAYGQNAKLFFAPKTGQAVNDPNGLWSGVNYDIYTTSKSSTSTSLTMRTTL
jgi:hypothetical protein